MSSAGLFAPRGRAQEAPAPAPSVQLKTPHADEMAEYLELPQIENTSEWCGLEWWAENRKLFPNLARMARQYLGCPATSATVERLFSAVGHAFSKKRRSADADTLADIIFTKMNIGDPKHSADAASAWMDGVDD